MFVILPFEVMHTFENGTSVTFPVGATINIGKYPEIAKRLEKYNKKQVEGSPQDKMIRASGLKKKDSNGNGSGLGE